MPRDRERNLARAVRGSLAAVAAVAAAVAATAWWQGRPVSPATAEAVPVAPPALRDAPAVEVPRVTFTNVAREAGIDFVHTNGAYGEKLLPETMGGGCALFDYDDDGRPDLLLVDSGPWPWRREVAKPHNAARLYHNEGGGRFRDVTAGSGLEADCYGMGAAAGDFDNDGRVDLYLTAVGRNRLFRNLGGGKFADATDFAGVGGEPRQWSSSCGFLDYDGDGRLDLFVCNYVAWSREVDLAQGFVLTGLGRAYGPPVSFQGTYPYLFHNEGNGRFREVSAEAGLRVDNPATGQPMAKSLGTTFADVDGDGRLDILVANDTVQNFLFHNEGGGRFREIGVQAGVGYDGSGAPRGAMGIDAAWFRNDASLGVAISNFANEMMALYVSPGRHMQFTDEAVATGLGPVTRLDLSFGLMFFDYDLDGRLDLLAASGHLEEEIHKVQASQRYRQSARLFWNAGAEQPVEFLPAAAEQCGVDLATPIVGRGAAYADLDGDGDLDVLLTQIGGAPLLLRNNLDAGGRWVRLKLVGVGDNRDAIGACVEAEIDGRLHRRQVMPTRSYLSQVELPVTLGLGRNGRLDRLQVRWPNGSVQPVADWRLNATTVVRQAPGETPP